ncbi:MAG: hypothetical protein Q9179_007247, partial [Wetmoreana sp. 5 TL-2023]
FRILGESEHHVENIGALIFDAYAVAELIIRRKDIVACDTLEAVEELDCGNRREVVGLRGRVWGKRRTPATKV